MEGGHELKFVRFEVGYKVGIPRSGALFDNVMEASRLSKVFSVRPNTEVGFFVTVTKQASHVGFEVGRVSGNFVRNFQRSLSVVRPTLGDGFSVFRRVGWDDDFGFAI
jgi:hypothetical protein